MSEKTIEPNVSNQAEEGQVYKEQDLAQMIELVKAGIWRDTNLSKVLNVTRETVARWKKRPEVIEAYQATVMKFARKRIDVEAVLKELAIESDATKSELTIKVIPLLGGATSAIPSNTSDTQIVEANETD